MVKSLGPCVSGEERSGLAVGFVRVLPSCKQSRNFSIHDVCYFHESSHEILVWYIIHFIFVCASCDNLNQGSLILLVLYFCLCLLCQAMPAAHTVNFLSVPTVTTFTSIYVIYFSLVSLNVIYVLVPAMTTYGGCIEYFIFVCATCDNMNQHVCYIYSSLISLEFCICACLCQLWQPMPGAQSYIFTYASCDAQAVPGMLIVIFLTLSAVMTCSGYADCYISTYASCARRTKFCFSTYANCVRLWQPVPGIPGIHGRAVPVYWMDTPG